MRSATAALERRIRNTEIATIARDAVASARAGRRRSGRALRRSVMAPLKRWRPRAIAALTRSLTVLSEAYSVRMSCAKTILARSRKRWMIVAKRVIAGASRSQTGWVTVITSGLGAALVGLFIWMSWHSRQIVLADTYVSSSNLALSVEQFVAHAVNSVDESLGAVIEQIEADKALRADRVHALLSERIQRTPAISNLMVIGSNGRLRFSSVAVPRRAMNVSTKKYFTSARDSAEISLTVAETLGARHSVALTIVASHRFHNTSGGFGGVVAATLNPDYMQRFFATLNVGDHGLIALESSDGTLLLQRPYPPELIGKNFGSSVLIKGMLPWASSGVFPMQSEVDGVWRIVGYQRVERLPLVVQVALSRDEALANWRRTTVLQALVVAAMLGVLTMMAFLLHRLLHARMVANRRLRATVGELEKARVAAEASSRVKSQFLANMSHELRTPLNAIIGFSEMIRDAIMGPVANRYREYARDIHNCGRLLLGVISDVLDLSKVEVGRLELREEQIDLAKMVGDCQRLIAERVRAGSLEFRIALPPEVPTLRGDELRLKQVLINLLSNAVKFTPAGGRIALSARSTSDGGIAIDVSDSGIGMKPEEIPIALEPFRQIESALNRRYEGTGLGLPLARTLMELHGGSLAINSTSGRGTTVTVYLPADRVIGRTPEVAGSAPWMEQRASNSR
jgi:two-component system, cell cycle sensor histidine kinase PleC